MGESINLISARGVYGTITPSDAIVFSQSTKAVWVTTSGNIHFVGDNQEDVKILPNVPENQWIPLNAKKIMAATTATIGLVLFHSN